MTTAACFLWGRLQYCWNAPANVQGLCCCLVMKCNKVGPLEVPEYVPTTHGDERHLDKLVSCEIVHQVLTNYKHSKNRRLCN
jgi:hypothetical protein